MNGLGGLLVRDEDSVLELLREVVVEELVKSLGRGGPEKLGNARVASSLGVGSDALHVGVSVQAPGHGVVESHRRRDQDADGQSYKESSECRHLPLLLLDWPGRVGRVLKGSLLVQETSFEGVVVGAVG